MKDKESSRLRRTHPTAVNSNDELVPELIEAETPAVAWDRFRVVGFQEIGSTNDEAVARARSGAPEGLLLFAEHQRAGKGRRGRTWLSPPRSGLCFSLVLRPTAERQCWPLLSLAAATAVALALKEMEPSLIVDLKWPNDVLLKGRKVAGILSEAAEGPDGAAAVVIGIGINVKADSVPAGLEPEATSVSGEIGRDVPRRRLLVSFLRHFQMQYLRLERGDGKTIVETWKAFSTMWQGRRVWVTENERHFEATTCGLTDLGALCVLLGDGSEVAILSADVSVWPA